MDSFVVHLLDGLSLGVIYGLLAMGYALASCAGRWFILTDAAAGLLGAAVSLMTLTASAMVGVRFEAVALLIAFIASFAAASVSGWAIGVNLHIFAARQQRGFLAVIAPAGLVIAAAAALDFANRFPLTNYLRPSPTSHLVLGIPGWFATEIAPEKLVIVVAGAVLFAIVLQLIRSRRFGRNYRAMLQDRALAELFGIDVARMDLVIVLISCVLAAVAGWLLVLNGATVDVNRGLLVAASAFAAAVLAGLRSVRRSAAGGFIAGTATALWSDLVSPSYGAPVIFAVLLCLLAYSPSRSAVRRVGQEI
jgi:branched-chain amino acid transport system permease protein